MLESIAQPPQLRRTGSRGMPPLASVSIPIPIYSDTSPSSPTDEELSHKSKSFAFGSGISKGKAAVRSSPIQPTRRYYGDAPLSVAPDQDPKRIAKIHSRITDMRGVWYQLRFGEDVDEVHVHEVLDYVSPQHLEEFEMKSFEEEGELLAIVEADEKRIRKEEKARKQRAKRKNVVIYLTTDDEEHADIKDVQDHVDGGRARPTYSHMFRLQEKPRRRRKRHPRTGELMPLSDHETDEDVKPQPPQAAATGTSGWIRAAASTFDYTAMEPPKKRRRKRHPDTGELMPLSPEPRMHGSSGASEEPLHSRIPSTEPFPDRSLEKRRRRVRHPRTGALMPLGWKWDPDAQDQGATQRRERKGLGQISPSMGMLTLSQEQQPKLQKVDCSSDVSSSGNGEDVAKLFGISANATSSHAQGSRVFDLPNRASVGFEDKMMAIRQSVASDHQPVSSVEAASWITAALSPKVPKSMTSILHPVAPEQPSSVEDSDGDDGEFYVEAIEDHRLSDPRTHDPEYGSEPIMLYRGEVVASSLLRRC